MSKSALKKALKKGFISVNGVIGTSATYIYGGETLTYSAPEIIPQKKQFKQKLDVLFQDDYLAIIKKPAGLLVSGNAFKTVTNALIQNLKKSSLPNATKPQPAHRLDYATTGLLLIGKTTLSITALNNLFKDKIIQKRYYAITIGKMQKSGTINTTIEGKDAISSYNVLSSVPSKRFEILNLVNLNPKSGKKHQLRKHLHSIGNPILGDKDYFLNNLILNGKGMYLHAYALEFKHPFTKEIISIKDQLPKRFRKIFDLEL
ncbi:RluA family pseudouridine synthase [Aurantibacter sp.]|uniref:RluA family pseudouridine synthase n=1 Tax=Aurantibacter sp. TaxID=2807103 RepID=UPI0035C79D07